MPSPDAVHEIIRILADTYTEPLKGTLVYATPFELLIATILAAQSTDAKVNEVTAELFKKYPTPQHFADANQSELEQDIHATGFFRQKAKSIMAASQYIVSEYGGSVPESMDELIKLHGVGRKTANVVLGNAYGIPSVIVDTHVLRIAGRLGLTDPKFSEKKEADKVEQDLMKVIPRKNWTLFSHLLLQHGRAICTARNPKHDICPIQHLCPTGLRALSAL